MYSDRSESSGGSGYARFSTISSSINSEQSIGIYTVISSSASTTYDNISEGFYDRQIGRFITPTSGRHGELPRIRDDNPDHVDQRNPNSNQEHTKNSKRPCIMVILSVVVVVILTTVATFAVLYLQGQDSPNDNGNVLRLNRSYLRRINGTEIFSDCKDLKLFGNNSDGLYTVYPDPLTETPIVVYCDMTTDGGGWTVFQHRRNGSVNFYLRLWDSYKHGFGEASGEHWIENKPTMPTTLFHISTIMTTMASSVLSSVSTTSLIQSTPISQTMAPTTVSKTEAVDTSTTTTTVIPTTVITTVIQTANPVTTVPTTETSTPPSSATTTFTQTTNPVTTVPTTETSTTSSPATTTFTQTTNPVTTVPTTETSTTSSSATTTVIQTTNPVTTVPITDTSTTPSPATTTVIQTTNPVTTVSTTETSTTPSPATTTVIQTTNPVTTVPTTETSTTSSPATSTVIQTTYPVTTVSTTGTSTTPSPATTTVIQTTHPTFTISSTGTFRDCQELIINGYRNDGVYTIYPYLSIQSPVRVYCDMRTDGGGWTVFQHRRDGSVDFYLLWDDYKNGFGEPDGEYWIGNDHLHQLTSWGNSDFYVRLEKFTGGWANAKYNNFTVADESDGYRMRLKVGSYRGNAGDSIESHGTTNTNGYKFSTSDIDNDFAPASCTVARQRAWWHNICTWANLNGRYGNGSCIVSGNCNFWYSLTNSFSGVKTSFMMVRRVL